MTFSESVLAEFEPDIAISLLEFGKSLSKIDADIIIFMARKSLCLYDVLLRMGIPPIEKIILSDRVLDLRLEPFYGKRIALIDDSLILGKTLAKSKETLELYGLANVTVHVFCIDETWWCKDLIVPDTAVLKMQDDRVMTFCTSTVRALSMLPRPYLVDFPISRPARIAVSSLDELITNSEWSVSKLSTKLQERNNVDVYTFFPSDAVLSEMRLGMGDDLYACIDLIKMRAFVRRSGEYCWLQLVPIVTLKPIQEDDLHSLLRILLGRISHYANGNLDNLDHYCETPVSRQRLIQYCCSAALGKRFMETAAPLVVDATHLQYDNQEAERHYGPWLLKEMKMIGDEAYSALWASPPSDNQRPEIVPAKLPPSVLKWASGVMRTANSPLSDEKEQLRSKTEASACFVEMSNLIADFTEVFLHLFQIMEIPARQQAQRLGRRSLLPMNAHGRDRLEVGLPWSSLMDHCQRRYQLATSRSAIQLLSIVLDLLNDLGIAVPITCIEDGVVYRAYRYGEDVKFSDGELVLAYEVIDGFLTATSRTTIQRITLEKLLVILIKVGLEKKFLDLHYGPAGVAGVVKIGFHLQGAILVINRGSLNEPEADVWLTRYLKRRGIIDPAPNSQFRLAQKPSGNQLKSSALGEAFALGNVIGSLYREINAPRRRNAPLDANALITLATCCNPRSVAGAMRKEIALFHIWYQSEGQDALRSLNWNDAQSVRQRLTVMLNSHGHESVHAARMKFIAFESDEGNRINMSCSHFLNNISGQKIEARLWEGYWGALNVGEAIGENERFTKLINKAATLCWEFATLLTMLELGMQAELISNVAERKRVLGRICNKLVGYKRGLDGVLVPTPPIVFKNLRICEIVRSSQYQNVDGQNLFSASLDAIEARLAGAAALADTIESVLEQYGREGTEIQYKYMLWYDVFDSTATEVRKKGYDASTHRNHVDEFRNSINRQFIQLTEDAKKNQTQVYCYDGNETSPDDGKHIYFAGSKISTYLDTTFEILLTLATGLNINLRVIIVPCNFAGSRVYRHINEPTIRGTSFLEHWSRLKVIGRNLETDTPCPSGFLLVATKELIDQFHPPASVNWINPQVSQTGTEIGGLINPVEIKFGAFSA